MRRAERNNIPLDRQVEEMLQRRQFPADAIGRSLSRPVGHVALNVHLADRGQFERVEPRQMNAEDSLFPVVGLRGKPGFLMLQVSLADLLKRVFTRRGLAEQPRLFDAQEFSRANTLSLRNVLRVRLALASSALRVGPTYPPTVAAIFALIAAVSFFGCLLRHYLAAFFGVDSEIRVGVGDDKAINTAKLLGGGSVAPQPASNSPKTHAAHFFSFPALLLASSAITSPPSSRF